MKKIIIVALSVFLAAAALFAGAGEKAKPVESQWAATPVTIDGFDSDWVGTPRVTADDGMAEYALKNDGTNLYLLFAIRNPKFLTTISRTGLTVYFDAAGKKSKDHGLRLAPKGVPTEEYIAAMERGGQTLTDEKKAELRKKAFQVIFYCELIGSKAEKSAPVADAALAPTYAAIGNPTFVLYEVRIPLSRAGQPGGIGVEPGKAFKLGFEWGGSAQKGIAGPGERPMMDESSESPERENEDMPSEGSSLGSMQVRRRPKKFSFWIDVQLAAAK